MGVGNAIAVPSVMPCAAEIVTVLPALSEVWRRACSGFLIGAASIDKLPQFS
jgi:hypothetical protein